MIRYELDKENKHLEDLLFHLRKHNIGFTGNKEKETHYIYVLENGSLKGATRSDYGWEWIKIKQTFYDDLNVLQDLLSEVCRLHKDKAEGIYHNTNVEKRINDLKELGFNEVNKVKGTKNEGLITYLDLTELCIKPTKKYDIKTTTEPIPEYEEIQKEKDNQYNKENDQRVVLEEFSFAAFSGDDYAGGIALQFYKHMMYVDLLAVNKEFRGNDIGTKLMNLAKEEAIKRNLSLIELGTVEFQARPFYEKLGYQVVHTRSNYPKGYKCYDLQLFIRSDENE